MALELYHHPWPVFSLVLSTQICVFPFGPTRSKYFLEIVFSGFCFDFPAITVHTDTLTIFQRGYFLSVLLFTTDEYCFTDLIHLPLYFPFGLIWFHWPAVCMPFPKFTLSTAFFICPPFLLCPSKINSFFFHVWGRTRNRSVMLMHLVLVIYMNYWPW